MALDYGAGSLERDALDDVRVQRALHEPTRAIRAAHLLGFLVEHVDEDAADRLPLLLRVGDPRERRQEALARVDRDQVQPEALTERADHLLGLGLAQQAVVHEDAREPIAERLVAKDGS